MEICYIGTQIYIQVCTSLFMEHIRYLTNSPSTSPSRFISHSHSSSPIFSYFHTHKNAVVFMSTAALSAHKTQLHKRAYTHIYVDDITRIHFTRLRCILKVSFFKKDTASKTVSLSETIKSDIMSIEDLRERRRKIEGERERER